MSWDDEASGWDEHPAVRAYAEAAFGSLLRFCEGRGFELEGARVLDFGCGTGLLTVELAPRVGSVVALDTSAAMIGVLEEKVRRLGLANVQTTTHALDEARVRVPEAFASPFDLVVCSSVCAFLEDYPGTAGTLARQLRPGGWLVQWDWELDPEAEEPYGLSRARIREVLEGAGLRDVAVKTGFEVPFEGETMRPLMGAGRR